MANFFHENVKISLNTVIEISSRGTNTYIGSGCVIDDFVKIKHVGGTGDVKIGENVFLNSFTIIYSGNGVSIGDNTAIGPNCSIVPINHRYHDKTRLINQQRFADSKGGVKIGNDVWIGAGVTILDGSIIGNGAVIGAGSLVNGAVPEYSINVGIPCKVVGYRT